MLTRAPRLPYLCMLCIAACLPPLSHGIQALSMLQVCRGLFQAHRLIFSFLICTAIQQQAQAITTAEWNFLLRGAQAGPVIRPNPAPGVLTPAAWAALSGLEDVLPVFKGLTRSMALEAQAWIKWLQSAAPHLTPLPASWLPEVGSRASHKHVQHASTCNWCALSGGQQFEPPSFVPPPHPSHHFGFPESSSRGHSSPRSAARSRKTKTAADCYQACNAGHTNTRSS